MQFSGLVHAGFDAPAKETMQEVLSLEAFLVPHPSRTFLLKVRGDSMKLAGIFDGDYILVERGREVFHGNIVIASQGNGRMVKYFVKKGEKAFLRSAEKVMREREVTAETRIIGVVVGVLRKYFKS